MGGGEGVCIREVVHEGRGGWVCVGPRPIRGQNGWKETMGQKKETAENNNNDDSTKRRKNA